MGSVSAGLRGGKVFKRRSARTYLMGLIAAAVVPVWLFAAYVLVSFACRSRRLTATGPSNGAAGGGGVDGKLSDMLLRIDALADSAAFAEGDFASDCMPRRSRLVAGGPDDQLRDEAGRQLLNTDLALGQPLPPAAGPSSRGARRP